jgi:hypothetical protein
VRIAARRARERPLLFAAAAIEDMEAAFARCGRLDRARLERVDETLAAAQVPASEAWLGRLRELQANVGDARAHREAAMALYNRVGDVQAAERIRNLVGDDTARRIRPDSLATVDLRLVERAIEGRWRGGLLRWLRVPAGTSAPRRVREAVGEHASGPYPPTLPDIMLADWDGFRAELGELLAPTDVVAAVTWRNRRRLEIRIHDGALQPLPWELADDADGEQVVSITFEELYRTPVRPGPGAWLARFLQLGLNRDAGSQLSVDGVVGPETRRALEATSGERPDIGLTVQRLHEALLAGANPRVVMLRAGRDAARGERALGRRYARAGLDPTHVMRAHADVLGGLLRTSPPPMIVHITAGLMVSGGAIALDLGAGDGTAGLVTALELDYALRRVTADWPAPVVVLDVPLPRGRRDAADQLLLRNGFAGDLFALGGARAVIATGLQRPADEDVLQDVLVEGVARGDAIGAVVRAMRAAGEDAASFHDGLAFAATALWADDPRLRLPAPRRS